MKIRGRRVWHFRHNILCERVADFWILGAKGRKWCWLPGKRLSRIGCYLN